MFIILVVPKIFTTSGKALPTTISIVCIDKNPDFLLRYLSFKYKYCSQGI